VAELCTSLLYFVVRARCRRKKSSRSLSHLLMSFLLHGMHNKRTDYSFGRRGIGSPWMQEPRIFLFVMLIIDADLIVKTYVSENPPSLPSLPFHFSPPSFHSHFPFIPFFTPLPAARSLWEHFYKLRVNCTSGP